MPFHRKTKRLLVCIVTLMMPLHIPSANIQNKMKKLGEILFVNIPLCETIASHPPKTTLHSVIFNNFTFSHISRGGLSLGPPSIYILYQWYKRIQASCSFAVLKFSKFFGKTMIGIIFYWDNHFAFKKNNLYALF